MTLIAELALTVFVLAPQGATSDAADKKADGQEQSLPSALSSSEQKKLNDLAQKWAAAWARMENEDNAKRRDSARKSERRAKDAFFKEWEKKEKKEPLKFMGDLVAIFDNVFEYKSQTGSGEVKTIKPGDKGIPDYSGVIPRGYSPDKAYPTIVLLPGWSAEKKEWTDPKAYFDETWKGVEAVDNMICYLPRVPNELDLDPVPDLSTTQGNAVEISRIKAVFEPLGDFIRTYNVDRARMILDCGAGACAYGLRLASYFPDRFAGLVLRAPTDPGNIRLDGLSGVPVLLVADKDHKEAAEKLAKTLNDLQKDSAKVVETQEAYPYPALGAEIGAWAMAAERDLFRSHVVLAPNHNSFRKGYWVEIGRADALETVAPENRPRLEATADRATNRITITSRGIGDFRVLLNDALLDLDKEFTIVVNGKAVTEKRERSLLTLTELMLQRFDPGYLWTCDYGMAVPKDDGGTPK